MPIFHSLLLQSIIASSPICFYFLHLSIMHLIKFHCIILCIPYITGKNMYIILSDISFFRDHK